MKHLDCFTWIWWFSLALQQSIWKENIETVWFSEIVPECTRCKLKYTPKTLISNTRCRCDICWKETDIQQAKVYLNNFPWVKNYWDITKIDIDNLPDFDLLTGWFPCQDVSVGGKQNLEWWRTVLVDYLLQILEKKQPKYFVFENVKGLMSKKFDEFRGSIFEKINKIWYCYNYKILNTKDFWLPQNRERVFIVWYRDWFNFPQWKELKIFLKDILEEEVDERYYLSEKALSNLKYKRWDRFKWQVDLDWITWTLTASMGKWYGNDWCVTVIQQLNNPKHSNNRVYWINWISPTLNIMQWWNRQPFILATQLWNSKNFWNCVKWDWTTYTLRSSQCNWIIKEWRIRKLTPTECSRLQGFPDNWCDWVSDSQKYKQLGNAISVPVVEAIFNNLFT